MIHSEDSQISKRQKHANDSFNFQPHVLYCYWLSFICIAYLKVDMLKGHMQDMQQSEVKFFLLYCKLTQILLNHR